MTEEEEEGWSPGFHTHLSGSLFVVGGYTVPVEEATASSLCDTPASLPVPCSRVLPQVRFPLCDYSLHQLVPDPGSVCAIEMLL